MNIFISYADEDTAYLTELTKRLEILRHNLPFTFWSKQNLKAGDNWKTVTNEMLEKANIILILVSADALASDPVYDEITQAISQNKSGKSIVVPIILRSCNWGWTMLEEVSQYCIDTVPIAIQANKDEAWTNIIKGISKYITK